MIINKAALDAIAANFSTTFGQGLTQGRNRMAEIATVVSVASSPINFPIAALGSDMAEWLGDRVIGNLAAWNKSLDIKDYEKTVGVPRNAILDDQLGLYEPAIRQLGVLAASFPWRATLDALMTDGFDATILGFDSVPFFSASHKWPGAYDTAQDNLTTENLDAAAVWTAIEFFRTVKGPDGVGMDLEAKSPDAKFVCAADLEETACELFLNERNAAGASNPLYGRFTRDDIIVSGRITAERWGILFTGLPVRPVVCANRQAPLLVPMIEAGDEEVFTRKLFRYGVDARFRVFALGWWLAYGSTGAE